MQTMLWGRRVRARTAERLGLVTEVVPRAATRVQKRSWSDACGELATSPLLAVLDRLEDLVRRVPSPASSARLFRDLMRADEDELFRRELDLLYKRVDDGVPMQGLSLPKRVSHL